MGVVIGAVGVVVGATVGLLLAGAVVAGEGEAPRALADTDGEADGPPDPFGLGAGDTLLLTDGVGELVAPALEAGEGDAPEPGLAEPDTTGVGDLLLGALDATGLVGACGAGPD